MCRYLLWICSWTIAVGPLLAVDEAGKARAVAGQLADLPAPAFEAVTTTGEALTLASLRGKAVLLNFWSSSCPTCVAEIPLLQRIRADFKEDLALVNVSVDRDCARAREVIADRGLDWPQVCNGAGFDGPLPRAFGVDGTPTQYVLRRDGRIAGKVTAPLIRTAIASTLADSSDITTFTDLLWGEARRDRAQGAKRALEALRAAEGAAIADVGAGDGYFTVRIADVVGVRGRVYAVEIDPRMVETLRGRVTAERRSNVNVITGRPDDPDLPEAALDGVLIVNAYHEFEDYRAMLEHLHRSLKPNGRLVIEDHVAGERRGATRNAQVERHEIAPEIVERELRDAGFVLIERRALFTRDEEGQGRWLIVARRPTERTV